MSESNSPELTPDQSPFYEVRVEGHLHSRWSARFDGMSIEPKDDGTTVLSGVITDQSALHGMLARIRDLGLTIVAVQRIGDKAAD